MSTGLTALLPCASLAGLLAGTRATAMNKVRQKSRQGPPGPAIDLEKRLAELESIVEQLESGELPLDKSLAEFERGVRLSRECQGALKDAEQRVQVLMAGELREFASEDPEGAEEAEEAEEDPKTKICGSPRPVFTMPRNISRKLT